MKKILWTCMAIAPPQRRKGFGTLFWKRILDFAIKNNITDITSTKVPAEEWMSSLGFTKTERHEVRIDGKDVYDWKFVVGPKDGETKIPEWIQESIKIVNETKARTEYAFAWKDNRTGLAIGKSRVVIIEE